MDRFVPKPSLVNFGLLNVGNDNTPKVIANNFLNLARRQPNMPQNRIDQLTHAFADVVAFRLLQITLSRAEEMYEGTKYSSDYDPEANDIPIKSKEMGMFSFTFCFYLFPFY